jgi:thiamine-phosphate pyrophosphorylase
MFSFTRKLYPITDRRISGLSHADQVEQLSSGGAPLIQLREKELPARAFYADAMAALHVARTLGTHLLINDRVDVALAIGADGVHLGQTDLPPAIARKLLGPDAIIGFSTHSVEQARAAVNLPVDYLAIGPIFSTHTKADPDPVVGLIGLREVRKICHLPLVAIGGINERNAGSVIAAGADAVAIIASLLAADMPLENRTVELLSGL